MSQPIATILEAFGLSQTGSAEGIDSNESINTRVETDAGPVVVKTVPEDDLEVEAARADVQEHVRAAGVAVPQYRRTKTGDFVAHCAIPVPMSSYRLTLVLPLFTTGCLPVILGLSQADPDLAFIGAFMIGGAAADLAMLEASICFHGNVQVQDHPSAPAFIILNKGNIESPDVQIQDTALS